MADSASWRTPLVGVAVLLLLLTACGKPQVGQAPVSADASAPVPSVSSSTPPNPRAVAESEALAAYAGMIQAWVDAAEIPDPDAPALRQFASGAALKKLVVDLFFAREDGMVGGGQPVIQPSVVGALPPDDPTEVQLADCMDASDWLKYKTTGELWDDIPGGRLPVTAVVKHSDAGWKVDAFTIGKTGTC